MRGFSLHPRYPFGVRTDYAQLAQAVWDAEKGDRGGFGILSAVICTRVPPT